jgi:hypothetical protein
MKEKLCTDEKSILQRLKFGLKRAQALVLRIKVRVFQKLGRVYPYTMDPKNIG